MTNRYAPNEAACPVPLDLLALMLRSDETRMRETVLLIAPTQRATLAVFCYGRVHLRALGFQIAALCDERSLSKVAGALGAVLFDQSREAMPFDEERTRTHRKRVSLARLVA
ncbi:MAG: hypothetical protein H7Y08_00020 [Rhizobiaceae bacterium]|nr:hypothetical protein [Rhizobiaceae bacterium]